MAEENSSGSNQSEITENDVGQGSAERFAKNELSKKVLILSTRYAKGPEATENIADAVAAACSKEIEGVVAPMIEELTLKMSDPSSVESIKTMEELKRKTTNDFYVQIRGLSLQIVVEQRTAAFEKKKSK